MAAVVWGWLDLHKANDGVGFPPRASLGANPMRRVQNGALEASGVCCAKEIVQCTEVIQDWISPRNSFVQDSSPWIFFR
jgi:hypothetical protein